MRGIDYISKEDLSFLLIFYVRWLIHPVLQRRHPYLAPELLHKMCISVESDLFGDFGDTKPCVFRHSLSLPVETPCR